MIKYLFKKETAQDRFNKRLNELSICLLKVEDKAFTELETVQLCNELIRKLNEHLTEKASENMALSVHHNQRANEIKLALGFLE